MIEISHLGISKTNTISDIITAFSVISIVEIDICFNEDEEIILCTQDNTSPEMLRNLLSLTTSMSFIINIKAFGIKNAQKLAKNLFCMVQIYNQHSYKLCSCNEYCVVELIDMKHIFENTKIEIGVISYGLPLGVFQHLPETDFIILQYYILDEEILEKIKEDKKSIYIWIRNDQETIKIIKKNLYIDGIIYDI